MKKITLKSSELQFKWGKILALVPFDIPSAKVVTKAYPAVLLLLNIFLLGVVLYGRILYFAHYEITHFIISVSADIVIATCSVMAIVIVNFSYPNELKSMIESLSKMEHANKYKKEQINCNLWKFVLVHILWFLYLACNVVQITSTDPWHLKYFLLKEVLNYQLIMSTLVMRTYVLIIRGHFEYLNDVISTLRTDSSLTGDLGASRNKFNVDLIAEEYTKLTSIIRQYNDIYGSYYILIYTYIIVHLIVPLNLAAVYGGNQVTAAGHRLGISFVANCIIWAILPIMMFRELFLSCESVMVEIDKLPENCFRRMVHLGEKQKKDLRGLVIQTGLSRPVFSAGGWFDINYKMILPTLTMIISYLIVLIQYHD